MLVKQLSVFMENRPGRLYSLTQTLGKEGIDLVTLSIADTQDYGIVRFIARDNDKAYSVLKDFCSGAKAYLKTLRRGLLFSPPSHSRKLSPAQVSALLASCFGRFHCAKNNTQLFLACYI